jgi:AcrR family transcriptional regulator
MPKVSEEYIQARRAQITRAAFNCFARNGVHRTTMQDIFAESGLSPGSVYTYFPGKNDILQAIADEVFGRIRDELDEDETLSGVVDRLMNIFDYLNDPSRGDNTIRFFIQMWAEALREPHLMELVHRVVDLERERIADVARRAQKRGELSRSVDPDGLARALIGLFHGLIIQRSWYPDMDVSSYKTAAKALAEGLS